MKAELANYSSMRAVVCQGGDKPQILCLVNGLKAGDAVLKGTLDWLRAHDEALPPSVDWAELDHLVPNIKVLPTI